MKNHILGIYVTDNGYVDVIQVSVADTQNHCLTEAKDRIKSLIPEDAELVILMTSPCRIEREY